MAIGQLVGLKFQVGLHSSDDASRGVKVGHAKYPNFNLVSSATREGMDWCKYIDVKGIGMQYDKACGHKEDSVDSPFGEQTCVIAVPEAFADEAVALFPGLVNEMTEAEFIAFYDGKAHAHEDEENIDTDALNGLKARRDLMVTQGMNTAAIDNKIKKALDPNNESERGVKKNKDKTWANVMASKGVSIRTRVS
jgi:hypothetical protein